MERFEHPYIVGIVSRGLGSKSVNSLKKRFGAAFRRRNLNYVYLLLRTSPKHLPALIRCMKMMDVLGVNVDKSYERKVFSIVDRIDGSAEKHKKVNLIARKNGQFTGYYIRGNIIRNSIKLWAGK